jgi:ribose transport system substrate-binding protein
MSSTAERSRSPWLMFLAVLIAATCLVAAGCGSDDNSDSAATPATTADAAETTAATDTTAAASSDIPTLDELYAGTETEPPAEGPPAAKTKSVWWVSCGMSIPDCSVPAKAGEEAATAIGWDFHIADGALNVNNGFEKGVRQALAGNPDAIILHAITCSAANAPLAEAKQKGIPVIGVESLDCSDPPVNGEDLLTYDSPYGENMETTFDYFTEWGKFGAAYLINKTDAQAKIILTLGTEPPHVVTNDGFRQTFDECAECEVLDEATFSNPDLVPDGPYVQRLRSALTKNPTANAGYFPFDVNFLVGGAQAAKSANPDMFISGGSGSAATFDLVREGLIDGISAHDVPWLAWGAIDNLNRIFNDEDVVPQGIGFIAVDKDHNLPAKGQVYESDIDFRTAYKSSWGVG